MKTRLSLFLKAPVMGEVKTRIAETVGPAEAFEIYHSLVNITLNNINNIKEIETELCVLGDLNNPGVRAWSEDFGFPTRAQLGDDLGERMACALSQSIEAGYRALLVGADCPELNADYVRAGVAALDEADIVFGPVEDGGYCLIGMKRSCKEVFTNIPWGSASVLRDSINAAQNAGRTVALLDTIWDVDYIRDWKRVLANERFTTELVSPRKAQPLN